MWLYIHAHLRDFLSYGLNDFTDAIMSPEYVVFLEAKTDRQQAAEIILNYCKKKSGRIVEEIQTAAAEGRMAGERPSQQAGLDWRLAGWFEQG